MTLARRLVERLIALRDQAPPPHVLAIARLHLVDAIGVGLAAAGSPVGAPYRGLSTSLARGGPASVFGCRDGAAAADAALINGGLIHSLEFDDTHTASIVHGSSVVAAAALAASEAAGASGHACLAAFARGWEVLIRLGLAAPLGIPARGFHTTSVTGPLAAALIACDLAGAGADESVAALGIALSQSSGVFEFLSNGSSVKSLHPGWAAHGGLLAAALARAGMTGPETALEGRFGFYRQFAGDDAAPERFAASIADLGERWHLAQAAFKFHPCCHYLHPFIEAAGLLAERGVQAADIDTLTCRVPPGAAPIICEPWSAKQAPPTGHAGRWSLPIAVAARLVHGRVDLGTFETPPDALLLALARRMHWEPMTEARFPERFEAELVCRLRDGSEVRTRVDDVFGNHSRPPDEEAVLAKFRSNARRTLDDAGADALEHTLARLADLEALGAVSQGLRGLRA